VGIYGSIRASWTLLNDPSNSGPFPSVFNGYKMESIVTIKRGDLEHTTDEEGSVMAPKSGSFLENGTIYTV
jgi:hypothetical protein